MAIDLARVRRQLRMDPDYTAEDEDLEDLIKEAKAYIEMRCDRKLIEDAAEPISPEQMKMTPDIERAALMLAGHWYANREAVVVGATSAEVEMGVDRILQFHKRY